MSDVAVEQPALEIAEFGGLRFALHPEAYSDVVISAFRDGRYEAAERDILRKVLRSGDRVFEVGSAVGALAMTSALIVGGANVRTFEANPALVEHALGNCRLNGLTIEMTAGVLRNALDYGGHGETMPFYLHKDFWASSLKSKPGTVKTFDVPVYCLEHELRAHRANVLVCDIEGGEIDLLTNADLSGIDLIVMEIHYWAGRENINRLMRKFVFDGFTPDFDFCRNATVCFHRGLARRE